MIELVDIGANLTHASFDHDRADVIARAVRAGVRRLIVTGASIDGSRRALELAQAHPGTLYATAGIHPHHAGEASAEAATTLRRLATDPAIVAVGECGLDFFRNFSPEEAQLEAFEIQLQLAAAISKPVFLHQRDAHEPFLRLVERYLPEIPGGVAHCFTGGETELRAYLGLGLHIGVTGWVCDERRAGPLRAALPQIPLDRIMLETDAPYLLPRDLDTPPPGRRNVPETLPHILNTVAGYMGISPERVAAAATLNTERLFGLAPAPD